MKKEDVVVLAQLLTGSKDALDKIEDALKRKDVEQLNSAKKELISFQKEIEKLL